MKIKNALARLPKNTAKAVSNQLQSGRAAKAELRKHERSGAILMDPTSYLTGFGLGVIKRQTGGTYMGMPTTGIAAIAATGAAFAANGKTTGKIAAKAAKAAFTCMAYDFGSNYDIQLPSFLSRGGAAASESDDS